MEFLDIDVKEVKELSGLYWLSSRLLFFTDYITSSIDYATDQALPPPNQSDDPFPCKVSNK